MESMIVLASFRKEHYDRRTHGHPPAEYIQRDNN